MVFENEASRAMERADVGRKIESLQDEVKQLKEENRLLELGVVNSGHGGVPLSSISKIHAMMKENDRLKEEVDRLQEENTDLSNWRGAVTRKLCPSYVGDISKGRAIEMLGYLLGEPLVLENARLLREVERLKKLITQWACPKGQHRDCSCDWCMALMQESSREESKND